MGKRVICLASICDFNDENGHCTKQILPSSEECMLVRTDIPDEMRPEPRDEDHHHHHHHQYQQ